ncbi:MAG: sigma 54-interacting transcriptional regulator [bacterium]
MSEPVRLLENSLLRLWRALLREKVDAGFALPSEKIEPLSLLFDQLVQRVETAREILAVAEPSENERLLFRLWPKGLPHLSDLRNLAQTQGKSAEWGEVEEIAVGRSRLFRQSLELALRIAPTNVPVTLLGETGVGKELFATIIHQVSQRRDGPFIAVNCGALPENLYAAELFGYEPGAFTGAHRQGQIGKVEAAHGGTLFLDEIGELTPNAQVALLRFLDSGEIQKIGRAKSTRVDVRVLCASNKDLESLVASGTFRQDLFYRVSLFPIKIAPLRQRREDILLLATHFLNQAMMKSATIMQYRFAPETLPFLSEFDWPGNVRQLAFAVERAMLLSDHEELSPADFRFLQAKVKDVSSDFYAEIGHHLQKMTGLSSREIKQWTELLSKEGYAGLSNRDVARAFDISETAARQRLRRLCDKGILIAKGEKRGRRYFLNIEHLGSLDASKPK